MHCAVCARWPHCLRLHPCLVHALLQDKLRGGGDKQQRSSSERADAAAGQEAAPAAAKEAAAAEERRSERRAGERERKLGPRLFDRAVAAAVRDSGKRGSEEDEARHRSSKRLRK